MACEPSPLIILLLRENMRKLKVNSATELMRYAIRNKIITP
jgi:hypothetical protein